MTRVSGIGRSPVLLMTCVAALTLLSGCDPAMSIRQSKTNEPDQVHALRVEVKPVQPFIGTTYYAPGLVITNSFDTPVTVVSFELRVGQQTYSQKRARPEDLPLHLSPGQNANVALWFDLHDNVRKSLFGISGEIQVHFNRDGREETATAVVVGGPFKS